MKESFLQARLSILVIGGAGYIGSHMVKTLGEHGHNITTFDNLSSGHEDSIKHGKFVMGDLSNQADIDNAFASNQFDVVMHFASSIEVSESVKDPIKYYHNNVSNTLNLLRSLIKFNVKKFIFSSTAAIFGDPKYIPIDENHPKNPINPYGQTKLMVENILKDYDSAYGLKSACLRYFNAAGADPCSDLRERHDPETHLIPLVLMAASGRRKDISLFGSDYETKDGTCIRDFIHVNDLCAAHLLAINYLFKKNKSISLNLGNGEGFSVQEVITTAKKITNKDIQVVNKQRRDGDPAILVANSKLAKETLEWKPKYTALDEIIRHAWEAERKFNN